MIWASNNVGFGLTSGGGLCASAQSGYGLTVGTGTSISSPGGMFNVKGAGATSSTFSMKVQNSSATNLFTIRDDGNVGVGTATPGATLHIVPASAGDGGIKYNNLFNGYSSLVWASNNVGFGLVTGGGLCAVANAGSGFTIGTSASNSNAGAMLNVKGSGTSSSTYSMKVQNSSAADLFTVRDDGRVGIGTINPQALLAVNGDIYSKKVKVTQTGWPDYVFNQEYRLRPLSEVEEYIKLHKHLPEVPSALQVEKEGVDIGDNQAALLKKIEELTLYIITLNKDMLSLKKQITQLENRK